MDLPREHVRLFLDDDGLWHARRFAGDDWSPVPGSHFSPSAAEAAAEARALHPGLRVFAPDGDGWREL